MNELLRLSAVLTPLFVLFMLPLASTNAQQGVTRYVRYSHQNAVSYGILEGETIRELKGDLFAGATPTGRTVKRAEERLTALGKGT